MHPYDRLGHLATPADGIRGCRTQRAYQAQHEQAMRALQQDYPTLGFRRPWPAGSAVALVSGSKWVVLCPCGDAPMASPEWNEARCFACGAIYSGLQWPASRADIEQTLLRRPFRETRCWLPGETVDELRAQNLVAVS